MSDKLDFSGFDAPPAKARAPMPPGRRPKVADAKTPIRKKKANPTRSRRKLRVNVSIEPAVSRKAAAAAGLAGMTLSDLVRASYRANAAQIEASWFQAEPAPFSHRSPASTGRIVHMLYLTEDEVRILDELASTYASSRSGVVAVLLRRMGD